MSPAGRRGARESDAARARDLTRESPARCVTNAVTAAEPVAGQPRTPRPRPLCRRQGWGLGGLGTSAFVLFPEAHKILAGFRVQTLVGS